MYHTVAAEPLLQACVADRRFAEYARGARAYIREASNQLGTFAGPMHTSPENLAVWARQMEQELWEAFVLHGLDLHGDVHWSDSSSSGSITGDETSLMHDAEAAAQAGPGRDQRERMRPGNQNAVLGKLGIWQQWQLQQGTVHMRTADHDPRRKPGPRPKHRNALHPDLMDILTEPVDPVTGRTGRPAAQKVKGWTTPQSTSRWRRTWMLALGLRSIDEEVGATFLPAHTMANLAATYQDHSMADRQMLMLAIHRVALALLAAMGEAVQQAVQEEGDRGMVTVRVEDPDADTDDTMWMRHPWRVRMIGPRCSKTSWQRWKPKARTRNLVSPSGSLTGWNTERVTNRQGTYLATWVVTRLCSPRC